MHRGELRLLPVFIVVLTILPGIAFANFLWPPVLYYSGWFVWWGVIGGLIAEVSIIRAFSVLRGWNVLVCVLVVNAVSAAVGLVALWPITFWGAGIDALIEYLGIVSVVVVLGATLLLNILIEYVSARKWCGVAAGWKSRWAIAIANISSFAVLLTAGLAQVEL